MSYTEKYILYVVYVVNSNIKDSNNEISFYVDNIGHKIKKIIFNLIIK